MSNLDYNYIFEFANSNTVRKYWQQINYKPNCWEAAWVVWSSCYKTLDEKLKAYQYIRNNFEDQEVKIHANNYQPFFKILDEYINFIFESLENIKKQDSNFIYYITEYCQYCDNSYSESDPKNYFINYSDCIKHIKEAYIDDNIGDFYSDYILFTIHKKKLGKDYEDSTVTLDRKLEPIDIYYNYGEDDFTDDLNYFFENIYVKFPLPFKKGDIVYSNRFYHSYKEKFVLDKVETADRRCDSSDMLALGYWLTDNDNLFYYESMHDNSSLEIVDPNILKEKELPLKLISLQLRGEIPLDIFEDLMHNIRVENVKSSCSFYLDSYKKELLNGFEKYLPRKN